MPIGLGEKGLSCCVETCHFYEVVSRFLGLQAAVVDNTACSDRRTTSASGTPASGTPASATPASATPASFAATSNRDQQ